MRTGAAAPRSLLDVCLALLGIALASVAVWVPQNPVGTAVTGPRWLLVVFPLVLAGPLAWRRTAPLLSWSLIVGAVVFQALLTGNSPEGLELIFVLGVGIYSVAAWSDSRRALVGLGVAGVGYGIYTLANHDVMSGRTSELWAGAFFAVMLAAIWLLGGFVRSRREQRRALARADEVEHNAAAAVAAERARLARELHDVVAHNLTIVVVQAAGARAAGDESSPVLETIERSSRDSLVEMRRLLGVLREDGEAVKLAPQPGVADIGALAEQVRRAGVPVDLSVRGDQRSLPPAIDLSAYRIVQESLTNVLNHAGRARATVTVCCDPDAVRIAVLDDGPGAGAAPNPLAGSGHGIIGMRERVTHFGGELRAGPRPGGGFAVEAVLVRDDAPS
jgi:signal transduction histidine kinase